MTPTTTIELINEAKQRVASFSQEAPRVSSGKAVENHGMNALLAYFQNNHASYILKRGRNAVKLIASGVEMSPGELARLLKALPGGRRIDAAIRVGAKVASYAFDGKLKKSRLAPPLQDGLILLWTEPDESLKVLEQRASSPSFKPSGRRLAKVTLRKDDKVAKANIYRCSEMKEPGFVLMRKNEIQHKGTWLGLLENEKEAQFCQVVIKGNLCWEAGIPAEFRGKFQQLARLAAKKSSELLPQSKSESLHSEEIVERLLESPRFLVAYQNHQNGRPPLITLGQIVKMLCDGGGQLPLQTIRDRIGLPEHRLMEIVSQMDSILKNGEDVILSLSVDQSLLLIDRERLNRAFSLQIALQNDEKTVRSETVEGLTREVKLPVEITMKERRVLEALLRYGRLSEGELAQIVGSRRVGGLLERLLSRLEDHGFIALTIVGEGDQGRIFEL